MKISKNTWSIYGLIGMLSVCLTTGVGNAQTSKFPYKRAGLTQKQAAAHLLNRFSYGPRPGEIDLILKTGLEKWFQQQLTADSEDEDLNKRLSRYDAINLSNTQVVASFPPRNQVFRMAVADGFMDRELINKSDKKEYREKLAAYMAQKELRPQQELFRQLISQKILRAAYTQNQLQEVLTDFWFNHFNVALNKNQCAMFVPAYERDVIRPNVLGKFETLLLATAKSPAMLRYLDNFSSVGINQSLIKRRVNRQQTATGNSVEPVFRRLQGLNENYAREVMELHTLGVDGGYTQQDVTHAARILTGWSTSVVSAGTSAVAIKYSNGSVREGDFHFLVNRHDTQEKVVLGRKFEAGGGYEEGVELLKMLANARAAAHFISKKIAIRFVSDNPPESLIDKMAETFTESKGDIKRVLITMVSSVEFWDKESLREKTKSPFELAISAVRSLNAEITNPYQLNSWISRMGQRIYYYQAPTGFPDKGQYWINTGALLSRMNFGLALAMQKIPGVKVNLGALANNHEPESAQKALVTYSKLIMPERDLSQTIKQLTPMLNDPALANKVQVAAKNTSAEKTMPEMDENDEVFMLKREDKDEVDMRIAPLSPSMLAQVVGVIIGSPEFQRR